MPSVERCGSEAAGGCVAGAGVRGVSAYVDPGHVTTNVTAGAEYGYPLVWVVVLANAMACVVRYLSAKLGVVTARRCLT